MTDMDLADLGAAHSQLGECFCCLLHFLCFLSTMGGGNSNKAAFLNSSQFPAEFDGQFP